jgi:microcompartment protein CcmK/EutM
MASMSLWSKAMILGIVRGSMYSTIQHPFYANRRKLVVDYLDAAGKPTGRYVIAVDSVDAGVGDRVLVTDEGNGARQVIDDPQGPVRSVIVGIVDDVMTDE